MDTYFKMAPKMRKQKTFQLLNTIFNRSRICDRGVVATEYALILPVFLALIVGTFEAGRIFTINAKLEGAVTRSTRIAMTGALPDAYKTRDAYIEDVIHNQLKEAGVTDGIKITSRVYESFENIGEPEPYVDANNNGQYDYEECYTDVNNNYTWDEDMGQDGLGGAENIVVMTVSVDLPFFSKFFSNAFGAGKTTAPSSSTTIRNEPFGGTEWQPSHNVICGS